MRSILLPAFVAGVSLVVGVGPASAEPQGISFVQVVEKEWALTLSRTSVRKGQVAIEAVNFGTDAHDLVVQGLKKGSKPTRFKQIDPRGRSERTLRLAAGRYALWCSLPGHRAKGMRATLTVRG